MFFLFAVVAASFNLCDLCVRYGVPALAMARSGATPEEIKPIAKEKCNTLPAFLSAVCSKAADTMLPDLIKEARSTTKSAEEYCKEKKIC